MSTKFAFKNVPGKQRGVTYCALWLSMIIIMVLIAYLQEGIGVFSPHLGFHYFSDVEFYCVFGVTVMAIIAFLLLVRRNFKIGISWGWLLLFLALFVGNAIGTFAFPERFSGTTQFVPGYEFEYISLMSDRIRAVLAFGVACTGFYLWFAIFPKCFHSLSVTKLAVFLVLLIVFSMAIYSLIVEWDKYVYFFDKGETTGSWITSYINNSNTYALTLLIGMGCAIYLHDHNRRFYYWPILFGLAFLELPIASGSGLACSFFLLSAYVTYRFFFTVRSHPGSSTAVLLLYIIGAITLSVFLYTGWLGENNIFTKIGHTIMNNYIGNTDLTGRTRIWSSLFNLLNQDKIRMGFGVGNFRALFIFGAYEVPPESLSVEIDTIWYAHNGIFQLLLEGGLLAVAIYGIVLIRMLYVMIRLMNMKSRQAWGLLLFFIAIMLQSVVESTYLLSAETKGSILALVLIIPLETEYFLKRRHREFSAYRQASRADIVKRRYRYEMSPLRMVKVAFLFITPILALSLFVLPHLFHFSEASQFNSWTYYFTLGVAFWAFPFGIYCIGHSSDKVYRTIFVSLYTLSYIAVIVTGIFLNPISHEYSIAAPFILVGLALFTFFTHFKSFFEFREKLVIRAYIPYTIIFVIIGGICWASYNFAEFDDGNDTIICLSLFVYLFYISLLLLPVQKRILYPVEESFYHLESRMAAIYIRHDDKVEAKNMAYHYNINIKPKNPNPRVIKIDKDIL